MKKLSAVTLILSILIISGCHRYGYYHDHGNGNGNGNGNHCPPGQAKKGNC